jgi:2-polyprenyl-3-methyl-5-hydroxy-6-metoxy-1,4-benzoquinol methylase
VIDWITRLKRDSVGTVQRGFYKLLVAPFKYARGRDYDAARYWRDRFLRHGTSLKSVGDEGLGEQANVEMYEAASEQLIQLIRKHVPTPLSGQRVLEVGSGSGYYTQRLAEIGVADYLGLDITDVFFEDLRSRHPGFRFRKADITESQSETGFDLALCIDVVEHIVTREKFERAMSNLAAALAPGGVLFLAPVHASGFRSLFYVRFWSEMDVQKALPNFEPLAQIPFRTARLFVFKKPSTTKA